MLLMGLVAEAYTAIFTHQNKQAWGCYDYDCDSKIGVLLCKFGDRFKICPQRTGLHAIGVCRDLIMKV